MITSETIHQPLSAAGSNASELYLALLKRVLSGTQSVNGDGHIWPRRSFARQLLRVILPDNVRLFELASDHDRKSGRWWPACALSMIGEKRMDNIQFCVEEVLRDQIPGDMIETGVWRGGAVIFIRAILKAYGITDRTVWAADSFSGLPKPDDGTYPADAGDRHYLISELAISLEEVQENFRRFGLLDGQVRFLKGWFRETLPKAPISRLAMIRLDGDLYESTMDGLTNLYPKLSVGGYLIVDDFHMVPSCRKAVHDYRKRHDITEPILNIDDAGVFWRREST